MEDLEPEDVQSLHEPLRQLVIMFVGHLKLQKDLLEKSMGALFTSSGPLLKTSRDVVDAITEAVQTVNNRSWFKKA